MAKPLHIDGIAGSQILDHQGELLDIAGADISTLEAGRGFINGDHREGFFHHIGRVLSAKKIFSEFDCENERQRYYWNKVKSPFIYFTGKLYNDEDHPNARACAAVLRSIHRDSCPLKLKASVEGGVVRRDPLNPKILRNTIVRGIALTFTPANPNTLVEPLDVIKSTQKETERDLQLIESIKHLAQTNVPSFRAVTRHTSALMLRSNLLDIAKELGSNELYKTISSISEQDLIENAVLTKALDTVTVIRAEIEQLKQDQILEKNLKRKIATALLGAALNYASSAMASNKDHTSETPKSANQISTQNQADVDSKTENKLSVQDHVNHFKKLVQKNPLLGAIAQVESSGGKNYNHATVNRPGTMHHGHTAGGMFGLMPHSVAYAMRISPKLAEKYPDIAEHAANINEHHAKITERMNNDPKAAIDIATALFNHAKQIMPSREALIHSWNHGIKGTLNRIKHEGHQTVEGDLYVQQVKHALNKLMTKLKKESKRDVAMPKKAANEVPKPNKNQLNPSILTDHRIKKALMAGYGGAGAPTALTGGGVIQKETIDPAFKTFKCNECGTEQVHGKFQTKCRNCNKALDYQQLAKLLGLK